MILRLWYALLLHWPTWKDMKSHWPTMSFPKDVLPTMLAAFAGSAVMFGIVVILAEVRVTQFSGVLLGMVGGAIAEAIRLWIKNRQ